MSSSDSDSESEWNREMFIAVTKKQGKGKKISEQDRCRQIQDCVDQGANLNALDKNGKTILDVALIKGYQEVVSFLRQCRAQAASNSSQLDSGADRLASNLDKLDIANISNYPVQQQSKEAHHRPTVVTIDNEQPSTSGNSDRPRYDSSSNRGTSCPKHKLTTDNEHEVLAKKPRLMPSDISQRERHKDHVIGSGDIGIKSISSDEDFNSEENDERTVQTVSFNPNETYAASGLKQTLHGIVYQWKHLMLVLNRAWKKGYSFRLSTEMDAAEKFDDLVLEYVDNKGHKTHRFVQLKHKKDNTKMISVRDLLDVKDGEFSVLKYFVSWRKIKECSGFDGSNSKTFTLCTNIGLDLDGLRNVNIFVSSVKEPDDFLKVTNRTQQPPRYKLQVSKQSELHQTLKLASDVHRLAIELAERVCGSKDIYLNIDVIKRYHAALAQEVIDVGSQRFRTNFIKNNNLSGRAKNFREIFFSHAKKLFKRGVSEAEIWKGLTDNKLKISTNFGTKFELSTNPDLTHVGLFSDEFIKLVNNASKDNVVKIDRRIYSKRASELSVERIFADNIDKLAGHVLIKEDKKIKFSSGFLNDVTRLLGNVEEFRDLLKIRLGSKFDELDKFEFEINNFKTCTEEELSSSSVTELPDDDISDGEILDFLDGFVLAVDQPDENELGEMIQQEIGESRFDLPDAKFFTDAFQIEILDWFKETGKQSVFLANENARDIFNEIEGRLSSLVTMDLRSEYPEKLEKLDIKFERENIELWKFIRSSRSPSGQIFIIFSGQTLLTTLRVHQTLKPLQRIGSHNGLIFVRLDRLFETQILDQVLRTFEWRDDNNLLVIDCESINVQQYTRELWNPVCGIMKRNDKKKMVLIIQGNQDPAIKFRMRYDCVHENEDNFSIVNLRKFSQQKLLDRRIVKFQGREESFGRLLRIRNLDNIELKKLEDLRRIIDSDVLVQLIKSNEIQIGIEMQGLGRVQDYYIPRRIVRHVIIKEGIMKASTITDLFAISDTDIEALKKLLGNKARVRSFDEKIQTEPRQSECIVLNTDGTANQFESLCERNMNRNIHWLQYANGKFIWIRSFGDIINLFKYRDVNGSVDHEKHGPDAAHPNENKLVDHDAKDRIVIFSDTAGMGKSTILTSLAEKIKDNVSRTEKDDEAPLFMIRINLTHRTTVLAEEKENRSFDCHNIDGAIEFLVDKLSGIDKSDSLASRVYETMIRNDGEAILFFDGFDEISPTYEHIVTDLLQALVKLPIKKLFVTTRPHTSEELERLFGTFSHKLQPFSPNDQRDFLKKFWKTGINNNDYTEVLEKRLERHAEGVIKLLARSISPQMTEFTGIPLQTRMVAEIYQYKESAIEDQEENQFKLPEKIDIIDLYQKFVDKKYDEFYTEKQPGDPTNLAARQSRADGHFVSMLKHQKFALDALFKEEAARVLLDSQPGVKDLIKRYCKYNEGVERAGIVIMNVEGKPHFVHRTFAEYFVATFLIETLKLLSQNDFLMEFFLTEFAVASQYKTIRVFLNCLLSREACAIEESSKGLDLCKFYTSRKHETVYYVGAIECNFEIVKFFLNYLIKLNEDNLEQQRTVINIPDYTGRTPLTVSIENSCELGIVKCFINRGVDVNWKNFRDITVLHTAVEKPNEVDLVKYLCEKGAHINCKNQKRDTPLHYATRHNGNINVVKYLCDNGADVNSKETWGETPLHNAARHSGNLEVIKYLCEKGADVSIKNDKREIPLHLAADCVHNLDVVEYLYDQGADLNCQHSDGKTPLHCASNDAKKLDVVKYLCDKGASMDCQDRERETPLHVATRSPKNLDVIKYLCEKGANLGCKGKKDQTPLHCATFQTENLAVVEYLCEKGADINCRDENSDTPLHYAVRHAANFDVVKYLCDNGASINCQQRLGYTPLHCAAEIVKELDVVKYLCEKGADVNIPTHGGEISLHRATHRAGNIDVVKYLCDKGASINCQDEQEMTPLHNAAHFAEDLAIVKYLCERGADVNCKDDFHRTPLYYAANSSQNLDVVEYLCEIGANVNFPDKCGDTALHQATRSVQNLNIVKYLCDKGASINCQNEKGESPLHFAAGQGRSLDVVQYLYENGASINCQNKLGAIPLHEAVRRTENLDVVKYLCENGADINCQLIYGWTPLHCAADNVENFEILKYLCDIGADVNSHSKEGETPLLRAAIHGNLDIIKYLVEKGADVNCKYRTDETPLHQVILEVGRLDIVKYLIDKGADINAQTKRGATPLHAAAELWQCHIIEYLIEHGADASITDNDGNTPLFLARYRCNDLNELRRVFGNVEIVDDV